MSSSETCINYNSAHDTYSFAVGFTCMLQWFFSQTKLSRIYFSFLQLDHQTKAEQCYALLHWTWFVVDYCQHKLQSFADCCNHSDYILCSRRHLHVAQNISFNFFFLFLINFYKFDFIYVDALMHGWL